MAFKYYADKMDDSMIKQAVERGHVTIDDDGKRIVTPKGEGYIECLNDIEASLGAQTMMILALLATKGTGRS